MSRTRAVNALLAVAAVAAVGAAAWNLYQRYGRDVVATKGYKPKPLASVGGDIKTINAHEHMMNRKVAWRMLKAMDDLGITKTVICAGATMTTLGAKQVGFVGYDENNREMLEIARLWPDRFIPFVTINPRDPDNVERLRRWFRQGAKGVKLYSGHGDFHHLGVGPGQFLDTALDDPGMMPVYQWLAAHRVPVLWHVNTRKYLDEFRRVLDDVPDMNLDCPHHCMNTSDPSVFVALLRDYPSVYADLSHGFHSFMADALRRVAKSPKAFRAAYDEFPDRFFWGSDTVVTPHRLKGPEWIEGMMKAYFGLFGADSFVLPVYDDNYNKQREETHPGLKLPRAMLKKFYQTNAERWLGVGADDTVPRRPEWPKWAADPEQVGLREAIERRDWEGLYVAANRLACDETASDPVRAESADALRRALADERVPARAAMRLAMGVPGLACLSDEEVARERGRRAAALAGDISAALDEEVARGAFGEMAVTLAEARSLDVRIEGDAAARWLAPAMGAVQAAIAEGRFGAAHRALLVAEALDADAPGIEDARRAIAPHVAAPSILARQKVHTELPGGITAGIAGAAAEDGALVVDLGVRNGTGGALALRAADFAVFAGGRRFGGEAPAKGALGGELAAGAKARGKIAFRGAPLDAGSYVLVWKDAAQESGKPFVIKERK